MFYHINIPDIHIVPYGDPYTFYQDELSNVLEFILDNPVSLVTIAGDLFDTIYKGDSLEIQIGLRFIHQLVKLCKAKDASLRMINGTNTHDYDQLKMFEKYEYDPDSDVKIIMEPYTEEFKDDIKVMYLPEEYSKNYNEFKEEHLDEVVDIIVFHGMVRGAMSIAEDPNDSEIILETEDIQNISNLYAVGGHIHTRTFIENNIWYTGSFSSKSYSDANEKKGFDYITLYDDNEVNIEFIENTDCYKFVTKDMTETFMTSSRDVLRARLVDMKRDYDYKTNVRIDVDTSNLTEVQMENLEFIKVKFRSIFDFKTFKEELDSDEETVKKKIEEANYVLDSEVSLVDKTLAEMKEKKEILGIKDKDIDKNKVTQLFKEE